MATMVKEKRREKKKSKEKSSSSGCVETELPPVLCHTQKSGNTRSLANLPEVPSEQIAVPSVEDTASVDVLKTIPETTLEKDDTKDIFINKPDTQIAEKDNNTGIKIENSDLSQANAEKELSEMESVGNTYQDLNCRLERISVPALDPNLSLEDVQNRLENSLAYLDLGGEVSQERDANQEDIGQAPCQEVVENVVPSAPVCEEGGTAQHLEQPQVEVCQNQITPKVQCMPLEEAIRLFGGREMESVRSTSEKEEAIVEAGPVSGPQHPLVDLLSTFRCSLSSLRRARVSVSAGYASEERARAALWRVERRQAAARGACACGADVVARVSYEHAELRAERLPAAALRLEALLREVQDDYCHHQHAALLAYCQIEELISEITSSSKPAIREALALVLQALRACEGCEGGGGGGAARALERWAGALAGALLRGGHEHHVVHLLHHLFRQCRSVRWAARAVRGRVRCGRGGAARLLALLDLVLTRPPLHANTESTEEWSEGEAWEEVTGRGGAGGAVREGALRERDLCAVVRACPLRDLLADILQLDYTVQGEGEGACVWEAGRACSGVRALLSAVRRAQAAHPAYPRLRRLLADLAARALRALAALHTHYRTQCPSGREGREERVEAELEACWSEGWGAAGGAPVPATLLRAGAARDYCAWLLHTLHEETAELASPAVRVSGGGCGARVAMVTQAAIDRAHDAQLARFVLEYLFQTCMSVGGGGGACARGCVRGAREQLPRLLAAHRPLHTHALLMVPQHPHVEAVSGAMLEPLRGGWWRGAAGEARAVLEQWAARCPHLLPSLLAALDYTPHSGLSLETQLEVGRWLSGWGGRAAAGEWPWAVLRALRVHSTWWGVRPDAPPPDPPPPHTDLFACAYAVLSTAWGHCVPLICSAGVEALCVLARSRPADAAHCAARVMLLMAHAPESVSLTPQFGELLGTLVAAGPGVVQRALGVGGEPGVDTLLRLILRQLEDPRERGEATRAQVVGAWLRAVWRPRPALPPPAAGMLHTLLLATREWALFDRHADMLLQSAEGEDVVGQAVRGAGAGALVCACAVRAAAGREARAGWGAALLDRLHEQRAANTRIHVRNALKAVGSSVDAEELAIYQCARAVLAAPAHSPAHLTLWALLLHLYLQRPPAHMSEATPPVGPLFFSGVIKSRQLSQLKSKLQETASYHRAEADAVTQRRRERAHARTPADTPAPAPAPPPPTDLLPELDAGRAMGAPDDDDSSDSSDSSGASEEEDAPTRDRTPDTERDDEMVIKYHVAAEAMCREVARWVEQGERARAAPHHADIARFIPEEVLDAAWARELSSRRPPPATPPPPLPAPPPPPPAPLQLAINTILGVKDNSYKSGRQSPPASTPPPRPAPPLDTHLAHIVALAHEMRAEAGRVRALDGAVWEHVRGLRVRRPLPPLRRSCANRCAPITLHVPHEEWCISTNAENSINSNRRSARELVRVLARPRPLAARAAAALIAAARRVGDERTAVSVAERVWARAGDMPPCACADTALSALMELLADRWLSASPVCATLVSRWAPPATALQGALAACVVAPHRLPPPARAQLYRAVLSAPLPPQIAFSYLSKFEMGAWCGAVSAECRGAVVRAQVEAAARCGPHSAADTMVLLELLGVHTARTVCSGGEACALVGACGRAGAVGALPPAFWPHVTAALQRHAASRDLPFEHVVATLREMGAVWAGARGGPPCALFERYAPHVAALLQALVRALAAAATHLSYAPERVSQCVWSGLAEAWAPWVVPPPPPPLLAGAPHADMVKRLVDTILLLMADCPGVEESLLQLTFEWCVAVCRGGGACVGGGGEERRVQCGALLGALRGLPWTEHQWLSPANIHTALQVCDEGEAELQAWCGAAWRGAGAGAWLRGAGGGGGAGLHDRLAALLHLFTAMPQHAQTLETAARLPWGGLSGGALLLALDEFFRARHDVAQPYHRLPEFRVLLFAAELCVHPEAVGGVCGVGGAGGAEGGREKRAGAVSRWVCAMTDPALRAHLPGHCAALLDTIAALAPHVSSRPGELEELVSRAAATLAIDPAADSAALQVWCGWVLGAGEAGVPRACVRACVSAAAALTTFDHFAALADCAVRAHLARAECGEAVWREAGARLARGAWCGAGAGPLCARARLHAGYAAAHAHAHSHDATRTTLHALLAANINFVEEEVMVAVWICWACRVTAGAGEEVGAAGRALLARWGEEPRRSLLRMVTMQADTGAPTLPHRALSRLALCVLSPDEGARRAYEAAAASLPAAGGASAGGAGAGGGPAELRHVPALALRLFPRHVHYFHLECEVAATATLNDAH